MRKIIFTLISIVVFFSALSFAQLGQTGTIKGTVSLEDDRTALPGVSVTLRSPAIVLDKLTTITNDRGQYWFPNLAPGNYELTFEMSGFSPHIRKDIIVSSNLTFTVDVQLSAERIQETVEVIGQAPTIDLQSSTKTTTLDTVFLESIPASRDLSTYFNMTPGITGNSAQGAAVRDNSYNLDGIQMNDPVVGTSAGQVFSIDVMEEISVQSSGLGAEYGSVKGAVVNVLTKSGGNKFSGALTAYYNQIKWQSNNTIGTPLEGALSGPKYQVEPGLTFGGPIIKDRLWFFLNMSLYKSEEYVAGFPYDKPEEVPIKDSTIYPYLKLTFQPSQKDKFVLSANYSKRTLDNRGADIYNTEDTTWKQQYPTYVISAIWTHTFSSNLFTNLKIGASSVELNLTAKQPVGLIWEYTTWNYAGSYGFDDLNPRKRLQMNLDGILFLDDFAGSHEMKFGFQGNLLQGRRIVTSYGPEDSAGISRIYTYTYLGEPYYASWGAGHDRLVRSFNAGVFVNDAWSLTKNLTLNLGLRFDYNRNYFPAQDGSVGDVSSVGSLAHIGVPDQTWDLMIEDAITAFTWKNISPRLGITFDPFGDGSTVLKANFSRYLQDNYTTVSFELHPVNWIWYEGYTDTDGNLTALTYTFVPGVDTTVGYGDHALKTPHTYEFSVGIEKELFQNWSVGARYVRRWDRDMIETVDATTVDIETLMETGEVVFTDRWQEVEVVDPYDNQTLTFYEQLYWVPRDNYMVNPPGLKRDYNGVELTIRKRYSRGWSFDLSYVYNSAKGFLGTSFWQSEGRTSLYDNPNSHVNAYGHVDLERRHQVKFAGMFKGPLGINMGGYFRYLSGRPYTRQVRSMDLGLVFDETIFAEPRGSRTLPGLLIIDLRLEKEFRIGDKFDIRVFGDAFNILNQGKATGVVGVSSNPIQTFEEMTSIQEPRVFRLGAKIAFDF